MSEYSKSVADPDYPAANPVSCPAKSYSHFDTYSLVLRSSSIC